MIQASDLIGGRYRLETPIPVTGPWEAWQAVDLIQRRPVALRLLPAEREGQPQDLERFRAAASLATKVSHPCVAQVFDYGELAGEQTPYLVMELVDAPSLAGLVAVGPLKPPKAMDVVAQAASGLHAAHAVGLAHGNLRPDCLLVSPDGQVKITDFVTGAWDEAKPAYLAPERTGASPGTPAGDLYSLGVAGYECLLGTPAFSRKTARLAAHPGRHLPPLPRPVPAAVAGLIDDLTASDPAKRPASAERVSVRAGLLRDAPAKSRDGQAKGRDAQAKGTARRRHHRSHDVPTPAPAPHAASASAPEPQRTPTAASHDTPAPASHDVPAPASHDVPTPAPSAADAPTPTPSSHDVPTPAPSPHDALTPTPTLVEGQTAILAMPFQAPPPDMTPQRRRSWWPLFVAGAGAVLAAGLAGWLLATVFTGASPGHDPSGAGAPASRASAPAAAPSNRTVELNDSTLAGQPVAVVTQRLRQLGLRPRVVWAIDSLQKPGTVITLQPSGRVPAGSVVTVTASRRPPGRRPSGRG